MDGRDKQVEAHVTRPRLAVATSMLGASGKRIPSYGAQGKSPGRADDRGVGPSTMPREGRSVRGDAAASTSRAPKLDEFIVHDVRPGDTAQSIALQYGVSVHTIEKSNKLWHNDPVQMRNEIQIPVAKVAASPVVERVVRQDDGSLMIWKRNVDPFSVRRPIVMDGGQNNAVSRSGAWNSRTGSHNGVRNGARNGATDDLDDLLDISARLDDKSQGKRSPYEESPRDRGISTHSGSHPLRVSGGQSSGHSSTARSPVASSGHLGPYDGGNGQRSTSSVDLPHANADMSPSSSREGGTAVVAERARTQAAQPLTYFPKPARPPREERRPPPTASGDLLDFDLPDLRPAWTSFKTWVSSVSSQIVESPGLELYPSARGSTGGRYPKADSPVGAQRESGARRASGLPRDQKRNE